MNKLFWDNCGPGRDFLLNLLEKKTREQKETPRNLDRMEKLFKSTRICAKIFSTILVCINIT